MDVRTHISAQILAKQVAADIHQKTGIDPWPAKGRQAANAPSFRGSEKNAKKLVIAEHKNPW